MTIAYCGTPPLPGELLGRFNADPVLIAVLAAAAWLHWRLAPADRRAPALTGWAIAAAALASPLCALSVSLFSARVGQHMILMLVAAPLVAAGLPTRTRLSLAGQAGAGVVFLLALWAWHAPRAYDATFVSTPLYWAMHVSLFGSAVWLWRELIDHGRDGGLVALVNGTLAAMQMGLLGALLTLASRPLYTAHAQTTEAWGLSWIADQQLGGLLMWVPGGALFLIAAMRSASQMLLRAERQGTISAGSA